MNDSLGNRMKNNYEDRYRIKLTRRMPVILRLDGKAFHTLTRNCKKPFDDVFIDCMEVASRETCEEIQGAKCGYTQSDELSILLTDFDSLETDAWFDYNLQKMVSVTASIMTMAFNNVYPSSNGKAYFDCRAFNVPKEEVANYFIWRQKDWLRNSLSMFARSFFSQKELMNRSASDVHEMLHTKGENWVKLDDRLKNGTFFFNTSGGWSTSYDAIFTHNRELLIEKYLFFD